MSGKRYLGGLTELVARCKSVLKTTKGWSISKHVKIGVVS